MSLWVSAINRGTVSSQRSCQEYPRVSAVFRLAWVNSCRRWKAPGTGPPAGRGHRWNSSVPKPREEDTFSGPRPLCRDIQEIPAGRRPASTASAAGPLGYRFPGGAGRTAAGPATAPWRRRAPSTRTRCGTPGTPGRWAFPPRRTGPPGEAGMAGSRPCPKGPCSAGRQSSSPGSPRAWPQSNLCGCHRQTASGRQRRGAGIRHTAPIHPCAASPAFPQRRGRYPRFYRAPRRSPGRRCHSPGTSPAAGWGLPGNLFKITPRTRGSCSA